MDREVTLLIITLKTFGVFLVSILLLPQYATSASLEESFGKSTIAVTGRSVYAAWHTNDSINNNEEVFFRASNDGGKTFGDKVYLSHTTGSNSTRITIDSDGDIVAVQWWESNQTDDAPAMRISNDYGETFGPTLKLSKNGTIEESG